MRTYSHVVDHFLQHSLLYVVYYRRKHYYPKGEGYLINVDSGFALCGLYIQILYVSISICLCLMQPGLFLEVFQQSNFISIHCTNTVCFSCKGSASFHLVYFLRKQKVVPGSFKTNNKSDQSLT